MKDTRAALRYAKAILNLAKESKLETKVNDDMLLIHQTIKENDGLEIMLNSPVIKSSDKIAVLNKIFENKVTPISLGLFHLLEDNKRIAMLADVAKQYFIIYDFEKHIQIAKVTTAVPISDEVKQHVLEKIKAITGDAAHLENEVNPSILGGFILRVGDIQYDASISNHLKELKKEFDNQDYIAKI